MVEIENRRPLSHRRGNGGRRAVLLPSIALALAAGIATGTLAAAAVAATFAEGIYALHPDDGPVSADILTNPAVRGVTLRTGWATVEPTRGSYDWSSLDERLAAVIAAGKDASLIIVNGGSTGSPDWLADLGVETLTFRDTTPGSPTFGQRPTIPLFWDRTFLNEKKRLIAALGKRYADEPGLRLVSAQCANATGDDFNVPSGNDAMAEWNRLGYSADLLISACLEIIDATMTAFPNQDVRMSFNNVAPRLGWPADYVTTDVIGRAREVWGERLIAMRHTLSAATPDPRSGQRQGIWEDILAAAPAVAGQMLWPATDVTTCRMNGGAKPCDAATMLLAAAGIGVQGYGLRFLEIYNTDLASADLAGVIDDIAASWPDAGAVDVPWNWVNAPASPQSIAPFRHETFYSYSIGADLGYTIWLPASYDTDPDRRFPVLYWLHGVGGDESKAALSVGKLFAAAATGRIRDVIVVIPNGGQTMYSDSFDGRIPGETMIVSDLIPHIDATYRTINDRSGRAIEGFSMGGFGALKLAARYPEMFVSVQSHGGALYDGSEPPSNEDIFAIIFNNDLDELAAAAPARWLAENRDRIIGTGLRIRLTAGDADQLWSVNIETANLLRSLGIPRLAVPLRGVRHEVRSYYQADDYRSLDFHETSFARFD